jgi:hypothetical protein
MPRRAGRFSAGRDSGASCDGTATPRRTGRVDLLRQNRHDPVVNIQGVPSIRLTLRSSLYVGAAALFAVLGFIGKSPWPILLAALLTVPVSIAAVACYYLAYGLLALIPGANPSSSSGSATSAPDGRVLTSVSAGAPAAWFTITTSVLGILALAVAALVNVRLLRALAARRRSNAAKTTPSTPSVE